MAAAGASCRSALDPELDENHVALALPGLDPAHDGLRVAQLSDVHAGPLTPEERVRAAVAAANAFAPDLIVLTGDYVTGSGLRRLRSGPAEVAQLAGLRAPVVAVLGNHDHWVSARGVAAALERLGCAVLRNAHVAVPLRGAPFTVVGIDDQHSGHADPARALRGVPDGSRVVLAHDPTTVERLRGLATPALVLSGHTHGGQLHFPPVSTLLTLPFRAGRYQVGAHTLYVNRGVGNTWVPLRVRAPPEVTLFTLRCGAAAVTERGP